MYSNYRRCTTKKDVEIFTLKSNFLTVVKLRKIRKVMMTMAPAVVNSNDLNHMNYFMFQSKHHTCQRLSILGGWYDLSITFQYNLIVTMTYSDILEQDHEG